MKLGIGLAGWFDIPIELALKTLSRIGYDGIEVYVWKDYIFDSSIFDPNGLSSRRPNSASARNLRKTCKDYQLEISAVGTVDLAFDYRNPSEQTRGAHIEFLKNCIDFGEELETGIVWSLSGLQLTGLSVQQSWEKLNDTMTECVDYASKKGLKFAIEPCNGQLVSTTEDCLRLIKEIHDIGINFDPSHFTIRNLDVPSSVRKLADQIIFTHIKGTKGKVPNYEWGIPGEYSKDAEDITEFATVLNHIGYKGYISIEIAHKRRTDILYRPDDAAQLGYRTASSVLDGLDYRKG